MTTASADPADLTALVADVVGNLPAEPLVAQLWQVLEGVGLTRVGLPEECGGSGGTLDDLLVIAGALAEHGIVHPLVEATTADWLLTTVAAPLLDRCTLAWLPVPIADAPGSTVEVPWAQWASHAVLLGADGGAVLVDLADTEITPGTDVSGAQLDEVAVPPVPRLHALESPSVDRVRGRTGLLRSAAMVGAIRGAYRLTKDHVRTRHQFGKPLIEIPAVTSGLATVRAQLIQAEAALALARSQAGRPDEVTAVATARVVCGSAATETARLAHQLHGAMGITVEYPLYRFTRILWAARDSDLPQHSWAMLIGDAAISGGENAVWQALTHPGN